MDKIFCYIDFRNPTWEVKELMTYRQRINLNDIAEEAGVSVTTVSLVLNGKAANTRIAEDTQKKVRDIAAQLGYEKKSSIFPVSPDQPYRIGIFCSMNDYIFPNLPINRFIKSLEDYKNYASHPFEYVLYPYIINKLCDKESFLSKQYYDGAVITTTGEMDNHFLLSRHKNIPIVMYNRLVAGYSCVLLDDYKTGKNAAKVLRNHDHSHYGVIIPEEINESISHRYTGFSDDLIGHGISKNNIFIAYRPKNGNGGYEAMKELLTKSSRITGIFVLNDLMTSGVLTCLKEQHIRIPESMEILSFGDSVASRLSPSVTSFSVPTELICRDFITILIDEIKSGRSSEVYRKYPALCNYRESCPK